jgi:predicted  nucleic acid-binding Zn-ribbon protein
MNDDKEISKMEEEIVTMKGKLKKCVNALNSTKLHMKPFVDKQNDINDIDYDSDIAKASNLNYSSTITTQEAGIKKLEDDIEVLHQSVEELKVAAREAEDCKVSSFWASVTPEEETEGGPITVADPQYNKFAIQYCKAREANKLHESNG